jgi:hypothetical protein
MGQTQSAIKIGFEDMQYSVKHLEENLIINTLDTTEQNCLIKGTLTASQEEDIVNKYLISQMRKQEVCLNGFYYKTYMEWMNSQQPLNKMILLNINQIKYWVYPFWNIKLERKSN